MSLSSQERRRDWKARCFVSKMESKSARPRCRDYSNSLLLISTLVVNSPTTLWIHNLDTPHTFPPCQYLHGTSFVRAGSAGLTDHRLLCASCQAHVGFKRVSLHAAVVYRSRRHKRAHVLRHLWYEAHLPSAREMKTQSAHQTRGFRVLAKPQPSHQAALWTDVYHDNWKKTTSSLRTNLPSAPFCSPMGSPQSSVPARQSQSHLTAPSQA